MGHAYKQHNVKIHNKTLIKEIVWKRGPLSKPEIAEISSLSLPTVSKIVNELSTDHLFIEHQLLQAQGVGRKPKTYTINEEYQLNVEMYFQHDHWRCCTSNMIGKIVNDVQLPALADTTDMQYQLLEDGIRDAMKNVPNVMGIGVGVPGVVSQDGIVSNIPQLEELEGLNLVEKLHEKFDCPIYVENDVKLMTIGYHNNKLENHDNIVFLYIGSGIGAGILIDGHLYKGSTNFAGEFGYIVTDVDSGHSMEEQLTRLEASAEPEKAREDLLKTVAVALNNCICFFNPEAVVLSSPLIYEEDLPRLRKVIAKHITPSDIPSILLETHDFGMEGLIDQCVKIFNTGIA
ncbi:MAG: ROK family protein [Lachnospiraceae bacterium]|jgi:predicted NBD/HSP70 family sugar kinase|nr:ROK family protein [Lachnospiraceae bacterium]MCI7092961.1 ROK family protein [Lachnospiraceae bacterium]